MENNVSLDISQNTPEKHSDTPSSPTAPSIYVFMKKTHQPANAPRYYELNLQSTINDAISRTVLSAFFVKVLTSDDNRISWAHCNYEKVWLSSCWRRTKYHAIRRIRWGQRFFIRFAVIGFISWTRAISQQSFWHYSFLWNFIQRGASQQTFHSFVSRFWILIFIGGI